jgi:alkylation response protein AidB-like acyl-CoA dehydrogenase
MNFSSSETTDMIRSMARQVAQKEILPNVMKWDESQEFPVALFQKLGSLGLMGILVPEEYGGSGLGYEEYVAALDEISQVDGSIGLSVAAHNSLCTNHILQFGNEVQKKKYLPLLTSGQWIGSWGLTEPNTGSDAGNMKTVAIKEGEYYVINGAKNFITHGLSSQVTVLICKTPTTENPKATSAFIIEKNTPGFTAGKKENKLGMRASETTALIFEQCRVHESQLLGTIGEGFKQSMKILDGGRISIAALSLGIAKGAFHAALQYSKEREQFNQPIANFQGISFKLADLATEIEAAEQLIHKAAYLKNTHQEVTKISAMAKYYASEVAVKAANEAVQILGGYGFTKDYPVEKFYRDAKLCTIGEGTSEIQKIVISKSILKQ